MPIRFLTPINIFAKRISSSSCQSTCVKIRTTSSVVLSVYQEETKSDYYSEEFSIKGRTSKNNYSESSVLLEPSHNWSKTSENHRMPVVAAVVAHRRILPAASTLANSAGSKISSCGAVRLSALSILPPPLGTAGVCRRPSSNSKYSITGGHFPRSASAVGGGGGGINGKGRPFFEFKQLGHLFSKVPPVKEAAILVESRRYYAKSKDKPKSKKTNIVINENEMSEVIDVEGLKKNLEKVMEQMKEEFTTQLSIRGAAGALESLQVEFEGEIYPLQELAQVGRKNPQLAILNLISLPDAIKPVLKAIEDSGMNLNPQQEGTTIYVPLPKVTREHRETLAKNAKALFMKSKVAMQSVQNKYVKQCKGHKEMSDDLVFNVQHQIMKYTESAVAEAEKLMVLKQKELLENK